MADFEIRPLQGISSWSDLATLIRASQAEGFRFLARLCSEYADGTNCFDRPGEVLLAVYRSGELIAIGGLNQDPYSGLPRIGRLRHVYVLPAWRHRGVGRFLVRALREHARRNFDQLVLRTDTPEASRFYEALGFQPEQTVEGASHRLRDTRANEDLSRP